MGDPNIVPMDIECYACFGCLGCAACTASLLALVGGVSMASGLHGWSI